MTHDYKCHGPTKLLASMNAATGNVLYGTKWRRSSEEVLDFFGFFDLHVALVLDVHVVLDILSAHKTAPEQRWLAHPRRERWHLHFTPTSSSWLNLVEGWFAQLTNRPLKM